MSTQTKTFTGTIYSGSGPGGWVNNPTNCTSLDDNYTNFFWSYPTGITPRPYLYGPISFNIPTGVPILGLEIRCNCIMSNRQSHFKCMLQTGTGSYVASALTASALSGYVATTTAGGSADLWGIDPSWLTPTNLNTNLRLKLEGNHEAPGFDNLYLDYITLTVYYGAESSGVIIPPPPVPLPEPPSLQERAIRAVAAENSLLRRHNVRYRGARESNKFNLALQTLQTQLANSFRLLRDKYTELENDETSLHPSETEIAAIQHAREQLRFKEWLKLKESSNLWFD